MKASEIAALLGLALEGPDTEIRAAAPLDSAGPGDLSFAAGRHALDAAGSRAACLILPPGAPAPASAIRAADPRAAFARAVAALHPRPAPPPGIHPTAHVAPGAVIGEGSSVGPHCSIAAQVRSGRGGVLHSGVTLYDGVTLGDRVVLHAGCVLGADGFGYAFSGGRYEKFPQVGGVRIGDDVEIGANTCIDRAALGLTTIGEGTKIDNLVHIGHNCSIGRHVVIAAQTGMSGGVTIGDHAVVGGQVGIGDKARIESGVVLGSRSGILTSKIVRKGDQPLWGVPAQPLSRHLAQLAALARLPRLIEEFAALKRRVDELRS